MTLFRGWLIFASLMISLLTSTAQAVELLRQPHVEIDWLAPSSFAERGETEIGIRFRPETHWHVYWKNPGDSGSAPKFKLRVKGAEISEPLWPYPARLPVAHLTNLGYEGETAYLFRVKTDGAGPVRIAADIEWLVCKEECIPGRATLTLQRPAKGAEPLYETGSKEKLEFFKTRVPDSNSSSDFALTAVPAQPGYFEIAVAAANAPPREIDLFPVDLDQLSPAKPLVKRSEGSTRFTFQVPPTASLKSHLAFVLVADGKAYEFPTVAVGTALAPVESTSVWLLIVSALLGGMILNLMPCVFPVISMKAISLLKTAGDGERRRDGWLYSLGTVTTFAALGAGFLFLRSLGTHVGWGFQLQSPVVVFSLIVLFWLMAMNFLGVFEFGSTIMNTAGRSKWKSSFGTGVLAVFVAAPCTGPFMGAALGATVVLPAISAMTIFIALGVGLAVPYLLLSHFPVLTSRLPKSGAWMETIKQFFAFPLFATVLWLLWVLGQQTGLKGWMITSSTLLGLSFAVWLGHRKHRFWRPLATLLAVALIVNSGFQLREAQALKPKETVVTSWKPYSEELLQTAIQKGQPVFIDFTAAWCITCQVNKTTVLDTVAANELFETAGILRLRADWTEQDPVITAALAKLGRSSVPVYAYYDGTAAPKLLPQILTLDMIRELAAKAAP